MRYFEHLCAESVLIVDAVYGGKERSIEGTRGVIRPENVLRRWKGEELEE